MEVTERIIQIPNWIHLIFIVNIVVYAIAKLIDPLRFSNFLMLLLDYQSLIETTKVKKIISSFHLVLVINQFLIFSTYIFLIYTHFNPDEAGYSFELFLLILFFITVFVLLKTLIEKGVAYVFSIDNMVQHILFNKLTFRNYFSIWVFAINLLIVYSFSEATLFYYVSLIGFIILNIYSLLFIYSAHKKQITSQLFYFILYLCTLEIAPYFFVYKILKGGV